MILNMLDIGMYQQRFPSEQLPFDTSKRTIVVLGSGWASTSFLKSIDTEQYNVVSLIEFFSSHVLQCSSWVYVINHTSRRLLFLLVTTSCSLLCCPVVLSVPSMLDPSLSLPVSLPATSLVKSRSMRLSVPRLTPSRRSSPLLVRIFWSRYCLYSSH